MNEKDNNKIDKREVAIKVENLSKTFKIPHEKHSSLKSAALNIFNKKSYETFKALSDVCFEVKKGEFFGIIGRNGSGKSTLLKILAGIYVPNSGGITINGKISPFLELGVGFNQELTGRENIFLGGSILGLSKEQIEEKFNKIVEFSELREFIDMKLKNYSSGMQVRLAFSLAINVHAEILLMDEVLAVGDTNFQSKCIEEFNKYREQGKTVVLVSHDIGTIQKYCDRALLLKSGEVVKVGDAESISSEYLKQNITDEENRISENNKKIENTNAKIKEDKVAEILSVEFLDEKDVIKNVFQMDDKVIARIYYNTTQKVKNPIFGVAIHNDFGVHISGPNTKTSKCAIRSIDGKGFIDFILLENHFYTGTYWFTAALFNSEGRIPYDFKDKAYSFRIICKDENQNGIIALKHIWKKQ